MRGRERTSIKEKGKSRDKYMCTEILYDPADMTGRASVKSSDVAVASTGDLA